MTGVGAAVLAGVLFCMAVRPAEAQTSVAAPVLLDEVVAVVAGKFQSSVPPAVVTRWDLEAECRLESILRYGESGVDRTISQSLRATVLDRIIDESIIVREAMRLDEAGIDEKEVAKSMLDLAGNMKPDQFHGLLEQAGLPLSKVEKILERRLVADRYVLDNLRLTVSLSESEIESSFASMDHPFKGQQLSDVHDEFREWLLGLKAVTHREKLLTELTSRCRVWVFFHPGTAEES